MKSWHMCFCLGIGLFTVAVIIPTVSATDVGGLICTDTTWDSEGSPYDVTQAAGGTIIIGCDATLTIEPNVEIRFEAGLAVVVGSASFGAGTLVARGSTGPTIILTSVKDPDDPYDPAAPGDWSRVHFTDYAVDAEFDTAGYYVSGSILEHALVEYAGFGSYPAVFVENSSPFLNHCEIRQNSDYGIRADCVGAAHVNMEHCEVWDNMAGGVYVTGGADHRMMFNTIRGNAGIGLAFDDCNGNIVEGNTVSGNHAGGNGAGIAFGAFSGSSCGGNLVIRNNVSDNHSGYSGGGLCLFGGGGGNTITENIIVGNSAVYRGGGVYFFGDYGNGTNHNNVLSENTVSQNSAGTDGGGICFYGWQGHIQYETLSNNIITNNTSGGVGGGVCFTGYVDGDRYNKLLGNTVRNNTATGEGGAIYLHREDYDTLSANVVAGNHTIGGSTGGIYVTDGSEYLCLAGDSGCGTHNIIGENDGYQITNNNSFDAAGSKDINARYVVWYTDSPSEIQEAIWDCFDDATRACVVWYPFCSSSGLDVDIDGGELSVGGEAFKLDDVYPSPSLGTATIGFALPRACWVSIELFDVSGRRVAGVVDEQMPPGGHYRTITGLGSGIYLCRMRAGSFSAAKKLVVVK